VDDEIGYGSDYVTREGFWYPVPILT
jgi:hypothetical protein